MLVNLPTLNPSHDEKTPLLQGMAGFDSRPRAALFAIALIPTQRLCGVKNVGQLPDVGKVPRQLFVYTRLSASQSPDPAICRRWPSFQAIPLNLAQSGIVRSELCAPHGALSHAAGASVPRISRMSTKGHGYCQQSCENHGVHLARCFSTCPFISDEAPILRKGNRIFFYY
jgi:hypothetical protein